ncbi:unnamed protein product [Larinioides sclopetarius]|uniref:Uncharacterized protein n=1 Tax=Larinioides sclopetarius TaxID=280406 RepID=A0AAV2BHD6_9ARAC
MQLLDTNVIACKQIYNDVYRPPDHKSNLENSICELARKGPCTPKISQIVLLKNRLFEKMKINDSSKKYSKEEVIQDITLK